MTNKIPRETTYQKPRSIPTEVADEDKNYGLSYLGGYVKQAVDNKQTFLEVCIVDNLTVNETGLAMIAVARCLRALNNEDKANEYISAARSIIRTCPETGSSLLDAIAGYTADKFSDQMADPTALYRKDMHGNYILNSNNGFIVMCPRPGKCSEETLKTLKLKAAKAAQNKRDPWDDESLKAPF